MAVLATGTPSERDAMRVPGQVMPNRSMLDVPEHDHVEPPRKSEADEPTDDTRHHRAGDHECAESDRKKHKDSRPVRLRGDAVIDAKTRRLGETRQEAFDRHGIATIHGFNRASVVEVRST